jgi:hypothetical protein
MDDSIDLQVQITNGNLDLVDDGIEFVIKTEKKYLVCECSRLVFFASSSSKLGWNGRMVHEPARVSESKISQNFYYRN